MLTDTLARLPARYWTLLALLLWGALALLLLRWDTFGIDEGAAHALLLNWSVADNIVNPIVIFGVPDFRALLFIPLGIYWPGSIVAAKVFTLLLTFAAGVLLYQWSCREKNRESALIATGLLLICPLTLMQVDSLGAGPYLLLVFSLGAWVDQSYREVTRPLGGKFFTQLLLVAIAVSMHPAGLAYPAALAWTWYKNPLDQRGQRHIYIGVVLALIFILVLGAGWHGLVWWSNPLAVLESMVLGPSLGSDRHWLLAGILAAALVLVMGFSARRLTSDLMGRALLLGLLFGLAVADYAWALLASVVLLYYGLPLLITLNESLGKQGFAGQRGGVMLVIFVVATWFMNVDKDYRTLVKSDLLRPQDQLIRILAEDGVDPKQPFRAISQWPARTMIAVKRDVLPLPPAAKDEAALLKMIPGVTHILFNPFDPANRELAAHIARLSGVMETTSLQEGGVIVRVRGNAKAAPEPADTRVTL